jgi:hypothetical protein
LSAPGTMGRATAAAAYRLGASTVTTLMMVPAVCADDAGAPAPCRLASCYRERNPVRKLAAFARDRAGEDADHNHGVF